MSDVLIKIRTILEKQGAEAAAKELDTLIAKQGASTNSVRSNAAEMEKNRRALAGLSAAAQVSQGSFTGLANVAYTLGGRFAALGTQITMVLGSFSAGWAIGKKIQENLIQPLLDASQAADQAADSVDALRLAQDKIASEANIKRVEALIDATDAYAKAQDASTAALNKQADVTKQLLNLQLDMEEAKIKAATPAGPERDRALQDISTRRAQIAPTIDRSLEEERIAKAEEAIAFRNKTLAIASETDRAGAKAKIDQLNAQLKDMEDYNKEITQKDVTLLQPFRKYRPGDFADKQQQIASQARLARGAEVAEPLKKLRTKTAEDNEKSSIEIIDARARIKVEDARLAVIPVQQQAAAADRTRQEQAEAEKAAQEKAAALREERIKTLQLNLDRSRDPRERFALNRQIENLRISQIDTPDPDIQEARSKTIREEESAKRRSDLLRGLGIPEPAYGAGERSESSRPTAPRRSARPAPEPEPPAPRRPSRIFPEPEPPAPRRPARPSPEPEPPAPRRSARPAPEPEPPAPRRSARPSLESSPPPIIAPRGERSESSATASSSFTAASATAAVAALESALADQTLTLKTLTDLLLKQSATQKTTRDQLRRRFD